MQSGAFWQQIDMSVNKCARSTLDWFGHNLKYFLSRYGFVDTFVICSRSKEPDTSPHFPFIPLPSPLLPFPSVTSIASVTAVTSVVCCVRYVSCVTSVTSVSLRTLHALRWLETPLNAAAAVDTHLILRSRPSHQHLLFRVRHT